MFYFKLLAKAAALQSSCDVFAISNTGVTGKKKMICWRCRSRREENSLDFFRFIPARSARTIIMYTGDICTDRFFQLFVVNGSGLWLHLRVKPCINARSQVDFRKNGQWIPPRKLHGARKASRTPSSPACRRKNRFSSWT